MERRSYLLHFEIICGPFLRKNQMSFIYISQMEKRTV